MTFRKDIERGLAGEKLLVGRLEKAGYSLIFPDKADRSYYDLAIKIGNEHFFFEVKYDEYAVKSGNLAFEFCNPKKGSYSGIMVTNAHFWCQIIPYDEPKILVAPTEVLIDIVQEHVIKGHKSKIKKKHLKIVAEAGDGNASLVLYQLSEIRDLFLDFNAATDKEIKKFIEENHGG